MSDKIHYLSDEELNKLMADVEADGLYEAPADIEDKVIYTLVERQKKKNLSFAAYCMRVGFGVAAAILLLLIVPSIPTYVPDESYQRQEIAVPSREEVLGERDKVPSKEEVIAERDKTYFNEAKQYFDSYLSDLFK
jgi:hypothetical protein